MVKAFLFLLSACACLGQGFTMKDTAFLGNSTPKVSGSTSFTPLTEPTGSGANIQTWWIGSSYATNGGNTLQFTDLGSVNNWHLTNMAATSLWPFRTSSNTWKFNGDITVGQYVNSVLFTNTGVREIWFVTRLYNAGQSNVNPYMFASKVNGQIFVRDTTSDGHMEVKIGANQDTFAGGENAFTNKWIAFFFDSDNSTKGFWGTNNVVINPSMNFGASVQSGFVINGRYDTFFAWGQEWAECITYSATNTAAARSNIYYYLKTYSAVCTNLGLP